MSPSNGVPLTNTLSTILVRDVDRAFVGEKKSTCSRVQSDLAADGCNFLVMIEVKFVATKRKIVRLEE